MTRIEFDDLGTRIPSIALPPFGAESDIPPTMFTFTDDADFPVAQYRGLGFTHFEAWCVGAAGGQGGNASSQIFEVAEEIWRPVSQDVWNLRLEQVRINDYLTSGEWDHMYSYGAALPGPRGNGVMTAWEAEEAQNPNHMLEFTTYRQMLLYPSSEAMGGGGGGGGFHIAAGVLADLPDTIPIVVGKAGVDAPYGQTIQNGEYTPNPLPVAQPLDPRGYPWSRLTELANFLLPYTHSYPFPHSSYNIPPQKGGDGGYSAFGSVGLASGGEGGDPGKAWNGSAFIVVGNGGDGGIGGRIAAGGGGAGSVTEGANGSDGSWHPETGIGAGGGGGKGGLPSTFSGGTIFGGPPRVETMHFATAGGQGSYSFADTSVYGQRQFRQAWTYLKPVKNYWLVTSPSNVPGTVSEPNGTVTFVSVTESTSLSVPGGGGGARPIKNLKVGSRATGYSPDGVVVIRLTKIT